MQTERYTSTAAVLATFTYPVTDDGEFGDQRFNEFLRSLVDTECLMHYHNLLRSNLPGFRLLRTELPIYSVATANVSSGKYNRGFPYLKRSTVIATLHSQADGFYTDRSIILMYTESLLLRLR